ncbi:AAA family ATPase, partial [Sphingobacterium multivorum]|uniref:AAA family ATPase n=1 Tax=Sphingobacterium multivorum TaxID=28454 RepID=UPI002896BADA
YGEEGEESFGDEFDPSLLLIEEPETNLHPKWQSLLAEMFYEANKKFNIQFVIETHSEYLIRNFQNLVASAALSAGNIKLFYLRNIKAASSGNIQVENVVVESDGGINYEVFDNGFFDESTNLQLSLLNIRRDRFITEFVELKRNLEENEEKLTFLEAKIDEFSSRTNFIKYVDEVNFLFEISKLDPKTVDYLASGLYLLYNIGSGSDFSPVILQYGRAMENELNKLFRSVDAGKSWKIGVMQGSLEKFKSGANTIPAVCNNSEFSILLSLLPNIFEDPFELEIELIDDLRKKRNEVAHPGLIMTKTDAEEYVEDMKQFLTSWTENMR